jgi:hypothetical protein
MQLFVLLFLDGAGGMRERKRALRMEDGTRHGAIAGALAARLAGRTEGVCPDISARFTRDRGGKPGFLRISEKTEQSAQGANLVSKRVKSSAFARPASVRDRPLSVAGRLVGKFAMPKSAFTALLWGGVASVFFGRKSGAASVLSVFASVLSVFWGGYSRPPWGRRREGG